MRQQFYFIDIVFFLGLAGALAAYAARTPRFYSGMALAAVSFAFWMAARIQLGASFSVRAEARRLVTSGLYSRLRNPIYAFGQLAFLGLAIAWGRWTGFVWLAAVSLFQWLRAKKEAAVLEQAFGEEYRAYRARTFF